MNCLPIKIGNYVYTCNSSASGYHTYTSIYNSNTELIDMYSYYLFCMDNTTSIDLSSYLSAEKRMYKVEVRNAYMNNNRAYGIVVGSSGYMINAYGTRYETTAPTANNPDVDTLRFVVLTQEPATYYNGYYYIIAPST